MKVNVFCTTTGREEIKKLISAKKAENLQKISEYRKQLNEELHAFCITNGGHDFLDWENQWIKMVVGYKTYESRFCWYCGFEERRNVSYEN